MRIDSLALYNMETKENQEYGSCINYNQQSHCYLNKEASGIMF